MPVTNQRQFEIIVNFMENNPEWAREQLDGNLFDEMVEELNAVGEQRDRYGWKKVCCLYNCI